MNTEDAPRGRGIYLLPNLFTLTALFAGFYAIIAAMQGNYENSAIAVFIAMVMDTLDGRVARLTHTQTLFGAELDSLSDMVSFGVAPSLISYTVALHHLGKVGWLIAFWFTATVALRLARFNTRSSNLDKSFFQGLPCPAGASVVVSLVWSLQELGLSGMGINILIAIVSVLISILMVSHTPFHSFKDFDIKNRVPFVATLVILFILVLVSVDPPLIWAALSLVYAASGPAFWLWRRRQRAGRS